MNVPENMSAPFFAYGIFKPGQLCFYRIKTFVKQTAKETVGAILKERDGIPLLVKSDYCKIEGYLIYFCHGRENEAYQRIIEIEPDEVYRWHEVKVNDGTVANVLLGRSEEKGSSDLEDVQEWDGRTDPYFKAALEEVELVLGDNSDFDRGLRSLFRLQMAYTLLWSAIERYASLRYYLGKRNVMKKKVYKIAAERSFADSLRRNVRGNREVFDTADLSSYTLDPDDADKSIGYYYAVRSNTVHRGKAVAKDFETLKSSLEELLAIFKDLLHEAFEKQGC